MERSASKLIDSFIILVVCHALFVEGTPLTNISFLEDNYVAKNVECTKLENSTTWSAVLVLTIEERKKVCAAAHKEAEILGAPIIERSEVQHAYIHFHNPTYPLVKATILKCVMSNGYTYFVTRGWMKNSLLLLKTAQMRIKRKEIYFILKLLPNIQVPPIPSSASTVEE